MAVRLIVALSLLALLAGCSSKGGSSDVVSIHDFAYAPATITVKAGTPITFVNHDNTEHSATQDDGLFDSGNIHPGDDYPTDPIAQPGTYRYHCTFHANMVGTIVVQ